MVYILSDLIRLGDLTHLWCFMPIGCGPMSRWIWFNSKEVYTLSDWYDCDIHTTQYIYMIQHHCCCCTSCAAGSHYHCHCHAHACCRHASLSSCLGALQSTAGRSSMLLLSMFMMCPAMCTIMLVWWWWSWHSLTSVGACYGGQCERWSEGKSKDRHHHPHVFAGRHCCHTCLNGGGHNTPQWVCMLWWSLVSVRGDQRARALSICGLWWWSGEMEVIEGWSQSKGCRWASSHCVFMGRCCCPQCCVSVCCRRYWHQWCSMVAVTICGQHHHHCCGSRQQMGIVIVELVGSLCTQLCSVVIWQPNPWPPFPYHYPQVARPIALLLGCITSHQVVLHQVALHQVISGLFGALSLPTVCFPSCTLSLLLFLRRFSLCLHTCLFSCCHSDPGHFTLTLAPPWPCHYIAVMLVLALSFLLFPLGAWYLFPSVHYIAL